MKFLFLKLFFIPVLLWSSASVAGEGVNFSPEDSAKFGLHQDKVTVEIPGLKRTYSFVWISDLHVNSEDILEVAPGSRKRMRERRDEVFNHPVTGLKPAALWAELPEMLNRSGADAVFFGGDICDTGSAANLQLLKDGFKKIKIPFIFLREDHDFTPWRLASKDMSRQQKISREIDGHPSLPFIEYDDLLIVGLDNSVRSIKPEVFAEFEKLYAKGKPVILLMHVPVFPGRETPGMTLKHSTWLGNKKPYGKMKDFLKLITMPNGPVKVVFCGHNHEVWDGMLAPGVRQHRFGAASAGNIGVILVKPEKQEQ